MMDKYEAALTQLGLAIPELTPSVGSYVPYVISGKQVWLSGQIPMQAGQVRFIGQLGQEFTVEQGQEAARICVLNLLAQLRQACDGDLDRVVRCIRLGGFVNCTAEFTDQPAVINGASNLIISVFGDRGRHARTAIGVQALPRGVAVEVDAVFEIA